MQEKQTQKQCQNSGFSAADFLARLSALQDPEKDSEIRAALSSLNWPAWLKPGSLRICCLKMYPACYLMTEGGHLRRSLTRWTDWGMAWNGNVLTAKISASPSQETACTLSDILMSDVEEKYFLSPKQQGVLLFKPTEATKESESTPPEGLSCTLAANPGGFGGKTGLYEVGVPIKCATKTGYQMAQVGDSIDLSYATVNSRRGRVGKEIAHTLTTGCQQGTVEVRPVKNPIKSDLARNTERTGKPGAPMHTLTTKDRHGVLYEGRIRRLTPRECLRLQGWADDRIDTVLAIQSDNQAYKQATV